MTFRFIAIDPGDSWTGLARLVISNDRRWLGQMAVFDMENRDFAGCVNTIMLGTKKHVTVCERFQIREMGHNRFSGGWTLQLIGGLRYIVESQGGVWHTVSPGDPDKHLEAMGLARYIDKWQSLCDKPNHANWHHARSAWRVLGQHLLSVYPGLLSPLLERGVFRTFARVDMESPYASLDDQCFDLVAPVVTWQCPAA